MSPKLSVVPRRSQEEVVQANEQAHPDQMSFLTGLACPAGEDRARQEFAAEVSVEAVLRRHGGGQLMPARPLGQFGAEVDYDVDLGTALRMVADAKSAYAEAPEDLRKRFPTFGAFVDAVQRGAVAVREVEPPPAPPQRVVVVPDPNAPPA